MSEFMAEAANKATHRLGLCADQAAEVVLGKDRDAAGSCAADLTGCWFRIDVEIQAWSGSLNPAPVAEKASAIVLNQNHSKKGSAGPLEFVE